MAATQVNQLQEKNNNSINELLIPFSKLKTPYLKEVKKINSFHVWYVDGSWIRKHLDPEFTNYGQHFRFDFIPNNEFWIDFEAKKELKYFVNHLLIEHKIMAKGKDYVFAVTLADKKEKKDRKEKKEIINLLNKDKKNIIKQIHKKLLFKKQDIKIWLVSGYLVRSIYNPSFTAGGHDKVYRFIPKGEVWIDNTIPSKDRAFVILHEVYERYLMTKNNNLSVKLNYELSHKKATRLEKTYMHNHENIDDRIKFELNRNK